MAYVNSTRSVELGLWGRLSALVKTAREALHRRHVYTVTMNELGNLSNRELADLGLHRSMIREVAHQAAFGK